MGVIYNYGWKGIEYTSDWLVSRFNEYYLNDTDERMDSTFFNYNNNGVLTQIRIE